MPQSPDNQQSTPQSDYPALSLPEGGWKSNIPPHLLDGIDEQTKWLMEEMSKNTQATEWNGRAALDTNVQVRRTNGRLKSAEQKVIDLQTDVVRLKERMKAIEPVTNTLSTVKIIFSNKFFLIIVGMSILFLLGYNRDILPAIARYFFGN